MPPPAYRPKGSTNSKPPTPSTKSAAAANIATSSPKASISVFFEVYRAPSAGLGWRWNLWTQYEDGRAMLASMSGRNHETQGSAEENLEAFKRMVASAPTRRS